MLISENIYYILNIAPILVHMYVYKTKEKFGRDRISLYIEKHCLRRNGEPGFAKKEMIAGLINALII